MTTPACSAVGRNNDHLRLRQSNPAVSASSSLYSRVEALDKNHLREKYGLIVHRKYYEDVEESIVFNHTSGATASITTTKFSIYNEVRITSANPQSRVKAQKSLEMMAQSIGITLVQMSQDELDEEGF